MSEKSPHFYNSPGSRRAMPESTPRHFPPVQELERQPDKDPKSLKDLLGLVAVIGFISLSTYITSPSSDEAVAEHQHIDIPNPTQYVEYTTVTEVDNLGLKSAITDYNPSPQELVDFNLPLNYDTTFDEYNNFIVNYTISDGDLLSTIVSNIQTPLAEAYRLDYNHFLEQIAAYNDLEDFNVIRANQTLAIPLPDQASFDFLRRFHPEAIKGAEIVEFLRQEDKILFSGRAGDFKSYMGYHMITDQTSDQWHLQQQAETDEHGLRFLTDQDQKYLMVALGNGLFESDAHMKVGSRVEIIIKNNKQYKKILAVVGDIKDDADTDDNNIIHSHDQSIVEFIVDIDVISNEIINTGTVNSIPGLNGSIVQIKKID